MSEKQKTNIESFKFDPIRGYPMLNWKGKRAFSSINYFPAQLKEVFGQPDPSGWMNKILWGDNLQVMSHLLKSLRGQVDLIYIDPPFDSSADYKMKIETKKKPISTDNSLFEEKQYTDIWNNDEYLQFMYERLILLKELLSDKGTIYVECDYRVNSYIRLIMDEIFGKENFINEIIWKRRGGVLAQSTRFGATAESIYVYSKNSEYTFNVQLVKEGAEDYVAERFKFTDDKGRRYRTSPLVSPSYSENLIYEYKGYKPPRNGWACSLETMKRWDAEGKLVFPKEKEGRIQRKQYLDEWEGRPVQALWDDIPPVNPQAKERLGYPTQKPVKLLERIIKTSSNEGDLVLDCFMGSGTTLETALNLKRRFIGVDINLGAINLTKKRLLSKEASKAIGLEFYNVNNYEIFRNPVEAKALLIDGLEIQKIENSIFDGEKDGRMVKIMPVNRIATRADLNELISGFDYKIFKRRKEESPNRPVEKLLLVCMGHEVDLKASLELAVREGGFDIDVEVVDILRDKTDIQFKRDSEAKVSIKKGKLLIEKFYPMNLLQKLSLQKSKVEDWKELVESVMIDWNYDGAVLSPSEIDIPENNGLVAGEYEVPKDAGTIRVKITDLLSESLEIEVSNG